jgi:hypothetical protein
VRLSVDALWRSRNGNEWARGPHNRGRAGKDHGGGAAGARMGDCAVSRDDFDKWIELAKAHAELAEWSEPKEFRRRVLGFDKRSPSAKIFNDSKHKFLRNTLVLAELSEHKEFDQIRLARVHEEWPDGYARTEAGEQNIEVTYALPPGYPMG